MKTKNSHKNEEDDDSNCSTPYVSAPSSPGHRHSNFFFYSAPTSPIHYILSTFPQPTQTVSPSSNSFEFQFSNDVDSSPSAPSADELFLNGQIRPLNNERSSRNTFREKPQRRRRTRSMSPTPPPFEEKDDEDEEAVVVVSSASSSSSSASSSGRSSKRWLFLKDFLRSKSEGSSSSSNSKFWNNISFSKEKEKEKEKKTVFSEKRNVKKSTTMAGKRRSAHEMHYAAKRAQAEEMRKKTYLPYRQGLLGCLGFNSKSYGAFHGFAKSLNPVSST